MADSEPAVYPGDETRQETTERVNNFFRDAEIVKVRGVGDEPDQSNLDFTRRSEALGTEKVQEEATPGQEDSNV